MFELIIKTESNDYSGTRIVTCKTSDAAFNQQGIERAAAHADENLRGATITYSIVEVN